MEKSCNICGILISDQSEYCETCSLMMSGSDDVPQISNVPEIDLSDQFESNQNYTAPSQSQNPFETSVTDDHNYPPPMMSVAGVAPLPSQPNYAPMPAAQNFSRPLPPPRNLPAVEKEYKPSLKYWISELPTFVKIIFAVLIFSVCFGVAIKGFMKMDVTVVSTNPDLEPQKAWFSSWIHSNPTPDQILEKYEKATFAQGKNLTAESFFITGKAQVIEKGLKGINGLVAYRNPQPEKKDDTKASIPIAPVQKLNTNPSVPSIPKPTDFKISFEVSIKKPDKFLMKMTMKPKEGFSQGFVSFPTMGYDGKKGWAFTKSYYNGSSQITEAKAPKSNYFFKKTDNGVALTFQRSSYSNIEYVGQEEILNRICYSLKAVDSGGKETKIFFDIETGLASKVVENDVEMYILDYTNFDGTMYPSKIVYILEKDWMMMTMEQIKSNVPFEDNIFERTSY